MDLFRLRALALNPQHSRVRSITYFGGTRNYLSEGHFSLIEEVGRAIWRPKLAHKKAQLKVITSL
jgi:hypothetical protein